MRKERAAEARAVELQGALDTALRRAEELHESLDDKGRELEKAMSRANELQAKADMPRSPHFSADMVSSSEVDDLRRELEQMSEAAEEDLRSERAKSLMLEESLEVAAERVTALEVSLEAAEERLKSSEEHWSK